MRLPSSPATAFASMTHARLRVHQGDYRGAGRLLREILTRDPEHVEARQLLLRIARRPDSTAHIPPGRRARRLERWLHRIQRGA